MKAVRSVVAGELVEVPGGVGLGGQHGVEAVGGEGGDGGVAEDACAWMMPVRRDGRLTGRWGECGAVRWRRRR